MADYEYPEAEHYDFPQDTVGLLTEELRLYRDGPSMREGIWGLSRMYERSELHNCLTKYSRLLYLALADDETSPSPGAHNRHADTAFFAGAVMAMHTILQRLPKVQRQYALHSDVLPAAFTHEEDDRKAFDDASEDVATFRNGMWQDVLLDQPEPFKTALVDVTARAFEDLPNMGHVEDSFMTGYLYTGYIIEHVLKLRAIERGEVYDGPDTVEPA